MAYPLTHLFVANGMAKSLKVIDRADFLLGSVAPDAVHYRKSFVGASMADIGSAKKTTHLCPISDEKWGSVTDNDGWESYVKIFLGRQEKTPFILGYVTHVLTDIYNNKSLWHNFRTTYPHEAKKGYNSGYYDDLKHIDKLLMLNKDEVDDICEKLTLAQAVGLDGLVSVDEVEAIKQQLIVDYGRNSQISNIDKFYHAKFVSYDEMLIFIKEAMLYASAIVF